jgi:hypothetical protein
MIRELVQSGKTYLVIRPRAVRAIGTVCCVCAAHCVCVFESSVEKEVVVREGNVRESGDRDAEELDQRKPSSSFPMSLK